MIILWKLPIDELLKILTWKRTASSSRNLGPFESLQALLRTTSSSLSGLWRLSASAVTSHSDHAETAARNRACASESSSEEDSWTTQTPPSTESPRQWALNSEFRRYLTDNFADQWSNKTINSNAVRPIQWSHCQDLFIIKIASFGILLIHICLLNAKWVEAGQVQVLYLKGASLAYLSLPQGIYT